MMNNQRFQFHTGIILKYRMHLWKHISYENGLTRCNSPNTTITWGLVDRIFTSLPIWRFILILSLLCKTNPGLSFSNVLPPHPMFLSFGMQRNDSQYSLIFEFVVDCYSTGLCACSNRSQHPQERNSKTERVCISGIATIKIFKFLIFIIFFDK